MEQRIELAPNCSLTPATAAAFFASICAFSGILALLFTWQGFWPVLVCWALEMLGLGLALQSGLRRRFYSQTLLVTESRISLQTRSPAGVKNQEFARHWAKVRLRTPRARRSPCRLMIESRGQAFEVGSFLTDAEKSRLANRLRRLVGAMNESPPLENDSFPGF
jgi:uncharacterized membrane protein